MFKQAKEFVFKKLGAGPFARKVLKNTTYNLASVLVSRVGAIIFTIIVARLLQPELYGAYMLALSVGMVVLTFCDLGINAALVRYVADALGKNNNKLARSYLKYLLNFKLALTFIFSISIFFLAKPLTNLIFHKPILALPLQIVAIYVFVQSIFNFFEQSFYALQKVKYATAGQSALQVLKLVFVPALIIAGYSVAGAIAGLTLSILISTALLLLFLKKRYSFLIKGPTVKIDKARVLKFFSYLTIASISVVFFVYIDTLMIGVLLPEAAAVGFYRAADAIVFSIASLITATTVLFPVFTQLTGKALKRAFQKVFHYSALFSFPAAFGLAFIAEPFISAIYGPEYLPASSVLPVLSFLIITSATGGFYNVLFAKEKLKWPTYVILLATALNIVLNYVLIIAYGIIGAAIATLISRYFVVAANGVLAKNMLNLAPKISSIWKPLVASLCMAIVLYVLSLPKTLLGGALAILIGAGVYFGVIFLISKLKKKSC